MSGMDDTTITAAATMTSLKITVLSFIGLYPLFFLYQSFYQLRGLRNHAAHRRS